MKKGLRISIFPAMVAVAALFIVLPRRGADATVEMVGGRDAWRFSPARQVEVDPGDRVAFTNTSRITHTATCVSAGEDPADVCSWDAGDVQPGQTVFVTMPDEQATYTFVCRYHGRQLQMVGSITTSADAESTPEPSPSPSPS